MQQFHLHRVLCPHHWPHSGHQQDNLGPLREIIINLNNLNLNGYLTNITSTSYSKLILRSNYYHFEIGVTKIELFIIPNIDKFYIHLVALFAYKLDKSENCCYFFYNSDTLYDNQVILAEDKSWQSGVTLEDNCPRLHHFVPDIYFYSSVTLFSEESQQRVYSTVQWWPRGLPNGERESVYSVCTVQ